MGAGGFAGEEPPPKCRVGRSGERPLLRDLWEQDSRPTQGHARARLCEGHLQTGSHQKPRVCLSCSLGRGQAVASAEVRPPSLVDRGCREGRCPWTLQPRPDSAPQLQEATYQCVGVPQHHGLHGDARDERTCKGRTAAHCQAVAWPEASLHQALQRTLDQDHFREVVLPKDPGSLRVGTTGHKRQPCGSVWPSPHPWPVPSWKCETGSVLARGPGAVQLWGLGRQWTPATCPAQLPHAPCRVPRWTARLHRWPCEVLFLP